MGRFTRLRRRVLLGLLLLIPLVVILFQKPGPTGRAISYTQFRALEPNVRAVVISGDEVSGFDGSGQAFTARVPSGSALADRLAARDVDVTIAPARTVWSDPDLWVWSLYYLSLLGMYGYLHRIARALESASPGPRDAGRV